MLSKVEGRKKMGDDLGKGKLLNDIETLSKALNLDKTRPKSSIPSNKYKSVGKTQLPDSKSKLKDSNEDPFRKEKKSIWSWKGLKALTSVQNKRFNCCFSLQVHLIEGLPPECDDLSLCVHWKRRDNELTTRPARVFEGIAEFEEQLTHTCSVYGSRSGPSYSAKYEAKHFLLYVSVFGYPELDLGKHRLDLTRLLPLTLEELEEEKSSGKWTTSFRLSGNAKGATLNVSFGYSVIGKNSIGPATNSDLPKFLTLRQNSYQSHDRSTVRRAGSLPARSHTSTRLVEDIKDLHEVLPISSSTLSDSVNMLYQKFDEEKVSMSVDKNELDVISEPVESVKPNSYTYDADKDNVESQVGVGEVSLVDHGTELSLEEQVNLEEDTLKDGSLVESLDLPNIDSSTGVSDGVALEEDIKPQPMIQEFDTHADNLVVNDFNFKGDDLCETDSLMKELESALISVSDLVKEGSDSQEEDCQISSQEKCVEVETNHKMSRKGKSLSLDDVTESVASEFLDMLGIEHSPFGLSSESEPESPRERLLRQFEKDFLADGCSLFNFDIDGDLAEYGYDTLSGSGWGAISEDFNHSSVSQAYEMANLETQAVGSKTRASMLEDLETEALMREWGLNENAFQCSPHISPDGFGSPIDLPLEQPLPLPPLGEGLGPFVQTKNGGFLRSMCPELFRNSKIGGSLVMQVSNPVVVPAEMGSGIMEILQGLASVGIEKLSMQASKLMPLEDISGKTMQQITWEADRSLEAPERQVLKRESEVGQNSFVEAKQVKGKPSGPRSSKRNSISIGNEMDSECVSLEDLAPLAMDKIEALSVEGLRIQSGMSDEDAPSNITPQSIGESSALERKLVNIGGSLGLEGAGGLQLLDIKDSSNDDGGLMGLSLTLDEWVRLDSGVIDDEDEISERTSKILSAHHATPGDWFRGKGERKRGKGSKKCGFLGNNFTVALMVQLRDPLRNYEPVGTPMLALIQVERLFAPPKPKIYSTVSEIRHANEDEDESQPTKVETKEEAKEEKLHEEEVIPVFKITEVHVAGLKTEPGKKKLWGSKTQQQSGSRWLLANGMGKSNKHPLMKSKAAAKPSTPATTKVQPGETLWSISSRVHGTGAKWKDLAALNPHIRNPNVIFPNETIRLR